MYGFTLRGPASRLAETGASGSPSSSFANARWITSGRTSNLIGAGFSTFALTVSGLAADLGSAALLARGSLAAGLSAGGFETGLLNFTVTLVAAGLGLGFVGILVGFLTTAALGIAFFGIALPGFLATLLGFFEGI